MKIDLIQLIHTLSSGEKRNFKLQCKKLERSSAYMDLYDIIIKNPSSEIANIKATFKNKHPEKSLETTAQYLQQILLDSLIRKRSLTDPTFQIYQSLMRSKIYFERSLPQEGYKELKRVKELSKQSEHHLLHYYTTRLELNHINDSGYSEISENELHQLQIQSKAKLQLLRQIQEHHTLYELLKYRLIHGEKTLSQQNQKKLNDLILSELSLITRGKEKSFESQKLHLLFQSFFFTHSGDFKSALKIFTQLNQLFEDNKRLWEDPPFAYFSTLEGILDSLRTLGLYHEMKYYLDKIQLISIHQKSDHFKAICHQIIKNYRLLIFLRSEDYKSAIKDILVNEKSQQKSINDLHFYKSEYLLYVAMVYIKNDNWKKAGKYLSNIHSHPSHPVILHKSVQLLDILYHYELNDLHYIDYASRNYHRNKRKSPTQFKLEKIIFNIIRFDPKRKSKPNKALYFSKIEGKIKVIESDKYEIQILQYFDFIQWIFDKLNIHR